MWGASPTFQHATPSAAREDNLRRCQTRVKLSHERHLPNRSPIAANDTELSSLITSPMREETIVVTARAAIAHTDVAHPARSRLIGDEGTQIDGRFAAWLSSRELHIDVGAHLVAATADCWTKMNA